MLGKLLKYEIPSMGRRLLPLYAAWAATAIVLGFSAQSADSKSSFVVVMSGLLYVGVAIAIMVMAVILIVQRYSRSLLGDEAYFNQVLPVSVAAHIGNKLLSAVIWMFITVLVALLTGLIIGVCAMIAGGLNSQDMIQLGDIDLPKNSVIYTLEFLILLIAGSVKTVMQIYTAITIGHQARNHTTLASIGAYIGVLFFEGTAGRAIASVYALADPRFNAVLKGSEGAYGPDGYLNFHVIFIAGIVMAAAFSAVYFFVCRYLMEKHLNLA